jgi:hypothetical protein
MNFERGKDPKESIGIGLAAESISITSLSANVSLQWYKSDRRRSMDVKLKKRWFIPMKTALKLLQKEKISSMNLSLCFYARTTEGWDMPKMGNFFGSIGVWGRIRRKTRKVLRGKSSAEISFTPSGAWRMKTLGDSSDSYSLVSFAIKTEDVVKAEDLKNNDKEIKGVIYKGDIYPIKPGDKELIV